MPRSYITLSPELVEYADAAYEHLQGEGYRVAVEKSDLYYPNTPTLVGKRRVTEFIVEVASSADSGRFDDWVHYGRARGKETYVALVLPEGNEATLTELASLRAKGIGVCSAGPNGVAVLVESSDLSAIVGLPDLSREKPAVRRLLKAPFRRISEGLVVDGFKDAATNFEQSAKAHFLKGVKSTRIQLVTAKGLPRTLSEAQIERFTLGQLGIGYGEIVAPTQADDLVRRAIQSILKDRNDATHHPGKAAVIRRIKSNVPKHVFAVLNALREIA
ncbi:hypothetical protein LDO26_12860 [Luteimonas sp. BDR2-5]|uniref:hypothetical protein n=1 Tax=Proluteimonas luteida TaxID=2878685 RepID=UPI001E5EB9DD|nr:hypothetical protein [Luteimonas sp. BDR2-5]MCD9029091.1 hypothetical protein [Luteimonas sp. BDR2-5]